MNIYISTDIIKYIAKLKVLHTNTLNYKTSVQTKIIYRVSKKEMCVCVYIYIYIYILWEIKTKKTDYTLSDYYFGVINIITGLYFIVLN